MGRNKSRTRPTKYEKQLKKEGKLVHVTSNDATDSTNTVFMDRRYLPALVHVGILAVHGSSFSVLASVLRAGPAISEHRAPIHGRYAGNTYPCQLGDAWWWSPGFGRDDCPEGGFFKRPARGDGDGVR